MPDRSERGSVAVKTVLEFYAAMRDDRVQDMLEQTAADVICEPLVRPGLSQYQGHAGMVSLAREMHAVHGNYQIVIIDITEEPGPKVTVLARIDPEAGHGKPLAVMTEYLFRDGLIFWIESIPAD
jgi:hypothetical protein